MGEGVGGLYSHWSLVEEYLPGLWDTLTPNFHPSSDRMMASPDTGAIRIHLPSLIALQKYRDLTGATRVLSGYRTPVYNASIRGSSPTSYHKNLIAWDVALGDLHPLDAEQAAREAGFTGIGRYPSRKFMHMDLGRPRTWYGSVKDKKAWEVLTNGTKVDMLLT